MQCSICGRLAKRTSAGMWTFHYDDCPRLTNDWGDEGEGESSQTEADRLQQFGTR